MLIKKQDGTFCDTHELAEKNDFDADILVDKFIESDIPYEYYKDTATIHFYDDTYEVFDEPTAKDFEQELKEFVEKELEREITDEELEDLLDTWSRWYDDKIVYDYAETLAEWQADQYDDYDADGPYEREVGV